MATNLILRHPLRLCKSAAATLSSRTFASSAVAQKKNPNLNRPGPPPLPAADQKEFEELVRKAQMPLSKGSGLGPNEGASQLLDQAFEAHGDLTHPDARKKPAPEFTGDVNPVTGERGGPKRNPLNWGPDGEWTYGGRATDF